MWKATSAYSKCYRAENEATMKVEKIKHCRIAKATILALSLKARMITKKVTESVKRRPKEYRVKKMQCRIRTRTTEKNEQYHARLKNGTIGTCDVEQLKQHHLLHEVQLRWPDLWSIPWTPGTVCYHFYWGLLKRQHGKKQNNTVIIHIYIYIHVCVYYTYLYIYIYTIKLLYI